MATHSKAHVGIRDLRDHLSEYVRQVKAGATLTITERGQPVGRIVPVCTHLEERLQELIDSNEVLWSGNKLGPVQPPAKVRGPRTVAELLLEDRE